MDSFQAIDRSDSRYAMKQRDIAATIARMGEATAKRKAEWESKLDDTLTEVTMENVLRGGGDRVVCGSQSAYERGYEIWRKSLK